MKRYDIKTLVSELRDSWRGMHEAGLVRFPVPDGAVVSDIYQTLCTLPDDVSYAQLKAIIPSAGWHPYTCTECNEEAEVIIEMGEELFIDSATVSLCQRCLLPAMALVKWESVRVEHDKT